ncbi:MAG: exonuclease SbcCD subunit D C-terminal domain-containing protein, partial [Bacteroidales bacterium]|nr:exonuclease SbcCD subunit D C-terminal domain-containing protein [Bacteroidales bacterium]
MLTVLHTADWHIGQNFYGYDRRDEHLYFFHWLKRQIREQRADVLLVAGDIFDTPNPSAESQRIYYRFLHEINMENPELQTIIIAGNHDSASRLEAPNPLLEDMNITVKGLVKRMQNGNINFRNLLVPITKGGETVAWCIAVPYLRQGDYPLSESYSESIGLMYRALYAELEKLRTPGQALIVMGHLQAKDAQLSDKDTSERTVIGGLECVPAEIFHADDIGYVALGHLHRCQRVAGYEKIQYAGSPLPMSFVEKKYKQGINLLKFDGSRLENIERIRFDPPVGLLSLSPEPEPLGNVLYRIARLPDGEVRFSSPYLEIKILLTEPEPSIRHHIETALKGKSVKLACTTSHRFVSGENDLKTVEYSDLKKIDPLEIAQIVYRNRYNYEMPDNIKSLLQ